MSGRSPASFGSLYYTDCRPGQGVKGGAGFQFQAASPGLGWEGMPLVAASALYEVPRVWMREQRPVADYPASLAHVAEDGLFATAAGLYLGKEANGNREGNQFTHAVVTRDASSYQLVRPAQLWAASWWATGPADGTEIDPVAAHPSIGPLDTDTVRDRVAAAPNAEERLVALLSAVHRVHDPDARRVVVLVATDPEEAACWIAAATLLLPAVEALRVSFKIFSADPSYSKHDIVGLHPDWAGRWRDTTVDAGMAVFDLDRSRYTPIEPTEEALFWVPRFLTGDAYDVVDAVELAGKLAGGDDDGAGERPSPADRVVAASVQLREPVEGRERIRLVAEWLRTASESAVEITREVLVEGVLAAGPDAASLRTLAEVAGSRGWTLYPTVRRGLLEAEIAELDGMQDPAAALDAVRTRPSLLPIGIPAEDEAANLAVLEQAIAGAPPERRVPALIALARRHRVSLDPERLRDVGSAFAQWWTVQTDERLLPDRWNAPPYAVDWARTCLRSALASGTDTARLAVEAIEQRWRSILLPEATTLNDPLDRQLFSAAARVPMSAVERTTLIRRVLVAVGDDPPRGTPPDELAWQVLFTGSVSFAEAEQFSALLTDVGIPMSAQIAKRLCAHLDALPPGSAKAAAIADRIRVAGHAMSETQQWRAEWAEYVRKVVANMLGTEKAPHPVDVAAWIDKVPDDLLAAHVEVIVDALVTDADRERAVDIALRVAQSAAKLIYDELRRRWPVEQQQMTDQQAQVAAFSFVLFTAKPKFKDQERDLPYLLNNLGQVVVRLDKKQRSAIEKAGKLGDAWRAWVAEIDPSMWGQLSRRARSSTKER